MGIWNWTHPGIGIWKVISDHDEGTIAIYDEKGKLIMEKKGLNKEAIEIIEKEFLDLIADSDGQKINKNTKNSMYA
jgi:hypothetical protein